jgi:hypothetical protein
MSAAILREGEEVVRAVAQRVHNLLELAAAETRLAALSILTMLLLVMIASAAVVIAWALLVVCVLYLVSRTTLGWPLPALCIGAGHVVLAYCLWHATVRLSRNLTLPELRTTLGASAAPREVEHAETA